MRIKPFVLRIDESEFYVFGQRIYRKIAVCGAAKKNRHRIVVFIQYGKFALRQRQPTFVQTRVFRNHGIRDARREKESEK